MDEEIQNNLHRWKYTLAAGPLELVQAGQFRRSPSGQLLRATLSANQGQPTVPASICEEEPSPEPSASRHSAKTSQPHQQPPSCAQPSASSSKATTTTQTTTKLLRMQKTTK